MTLKSLEASKSSYLLYISSAFIFYFLLFNFYILLLTFSFNFIYIFIFNFTFLKNSLLSTINISFLVITLSK